VKGIGTLPREWKENDAMYKWFTSEGLFWYTEFDGLQKTKTKKKGWGSWLVWFERERDGCSLGKETSS